MQRHAAAFLYRPQPFCLNSCQGGKSSALDEKIWRGLFAHLGASSRSNAVPAGHAVIYVGDRGATSSASGKRGKSGIDLSPIAQIATCLEEEEGTRGPNSTPPQNPLRCQPKGHGDELSASVDARAGSIGPYQLVQWKSSPLLRDGVTIPGRASE